jgi:2-desacetyl-2-hydroxyethyl bacteriochlorophyllide A dehydrogenase
VKTIVLDEPYSFRLTETELPGEPGPGEALLRVLRVGICGTDLHAYQGNQPFFSYPRILGHELAVEIVALGESDGAHGLAVGDLCAVEPYLNCGTCVACRRGSTNCCEKLLTLGVHTDGGMREYVILPIHKLHKANDVPPEQLALVEMLCIGAHAARRAGIESGEPALVVGAGPIGLGTMQYARALGADVLAMDINPRRLAFCQDDLGVTMTVDAREDPVDQLRAHLGGELPRLVFDATGNAKSMMAAFDYVAHSGRIVFVGLVKGDICFSDPYLHSHELTLLATRNATGNDFRWVIDTLASGQVSVRGWDTHHATPEAMIEQYPSWILPGTGVIKAMVSFE